MRPLLAYRPLCTNAGSQLRVSQRRVQFCGSLLSNCWQKASPDRHPAETSSDKRAIRAIVRQADSSPCCSVTESRTACSKSACIALLSRLFCPNCTALNCPNLATRPLCVLRQHHGHFAPFTSLQHCLIKGFLLSSLLDSLLHISVFLEL